MDEAVNRYARDLIDAARAAVARDAEVQACHERAKADGIELKVSLEAAVVADGRDEPVARVEVPASQPAPVTGPRDLTAADRRFLRSLRIAADQDENR